MTIGLVAVTVHNPFSLIIKGPAKWGGVFGKGKRELLLEPDVMECHLVSGAFDYLVKFRLGRELKGHFSVWVSGNWRLTFTFDGTDAVLVKSGQSLNWSNDDGTHVQPHASRPDAA